MQSAAAEALDIPSCILPGAVDKGLGGLYHGGYKAAMNLDFFKEVGITHVVNTATNPKKEVAFVLKYTRAEHHTSKEVKVVYLGLKWVDDVSFTIPDEDLIRCACFIHQARTDGTSVLVNCAKGRSRSTTAIIAYLMATGWRSYEEALKFVQERRPIAQPNPTFAAKLQKFAHSEALKLLMKELNT